MAAFLLSRQQRRKLQRDYLERGRKTLARGLGPELVEAEAIGVTLLLHECLTDKARAQPAAEAAAIAETLLDKSLVVDLEGHDLGCRKGCSFCCSALVTCAAPEIFRVANWLRQNAGSPSSPFELASIALEGARRHGLPSQQRFTERAPCPLLVSQACGVYAVRPIPCRALHSLSSEACRLALEEDKGEVPIIAPAMHKGEMARTLLLAAVSAAGLSDRGIELTAGVTAVIDKPDAEARWLAGDDVFEGVLSGQRAPDARQAQDQISRLVRELVA